MSDTQTRDAWGSKIGLILAAAGNAIGIGNLLRFPGKAADNGGGAFMIPYVVCLLLFGLPMMWVAWSIGRHGGAFGHGSLPGMFHRMWRWKGAKYVGVLGLALPMVFVLYYTYIEAWCLGYAWFSFSGDYLQSADRTVHMSSYFNEFLGDAPTSSYFSGLGAALAAMGVTLVLNVWVLSRGVAKGIEVLAKIAIPLLFIFCIALVVRIFTLEAKADTAIAGLNFLWTPDVTKLSDFQVWMEAAGQIFFTLSIGFGSLECYASYLKKDDDIALTGLSTAATNEFVEIIFGSMIAIPAAALFYGVDRVSEVAGSTFGLGMISIPEVLREFPGAEIFGGIWFLLLFFAAFTSSVAVAQPVMAFFQDEFKVSRAKAALWLAGLWGVGVIPVIVFFKYGYLDELDFWSGTMGLVVLALIEAVLFAWIFGIEKGWAELTRGAMVQVPGLFRVIVKYVTPVALIVILVGWGWDAISTGKLLPTPKRTVAIAEPHRFAGTLSATEFGEDLSPEDQRKKTVVEAFEKELDEAAETAGGDGSIRATVKLGADGGVSVSDVSAEGCVSAFTDAARLSEYLISRGTAYKEVGNEAALAREVPLVIDVRHKAPYIWMARAEIGAFVLIFLWMIRSSFRRHEQNEGAAA